jgi:solute carrier family 13 (sodium-dependent dicarboxylate transporter), member 2/3/5
MKALITNKLVQLLIAFLLASFILITKGQSGEDALMWRSIALAVFMVFLWLLEVIPIYVTALFPLVFSSVLGILTPKDLAIAYGDSNIYLFLGGFILAAGLEKHKVHVQLSKRVIKFVGNTKGRMLLGFTFSTGFLSMWISNTATALMMLPIGFAIMKTLPKDKDHSKFSLFLVLSIAYAASIGGVGTLIGSPPNLIMAALINQEPYNAGIEFMDWAKFGIPFALVFLFVMYLTFRFFLGKESNEVIDLKDIEVQAWTKNQLRVIGVFGVVVFLWMTKEFNQTYLNFTYTDVFPAMLGAVALFIVPQDGKPKPLLNWKATRKLPWGVLLLFGGGIAMASALQQHGAIALIAESFAFFQNMPFVVILLILVTISVFATELISNTALTNILVPIVASFALSAHLPLVPLSIAITLGASCAFMLPIGTPPNAIAFASGKVKMKEMVRYGMVLNIISIILITLLSWLFL